MALAQGRKGDSFANRHIEGGHHIVPSLSKSRMQRSSQPRPLSEDDTGLQLQFIVNKQKIRSHTKSRRGCLACKGRKVKCSETRPSCSNCIRRETRCVYPPKPKYADDEEDGDSNEGSGSLDPTPSLPNGLNMADLRLMHHFILYAHPYVPLGHQSAWVTEIPARAHEYPHLMHAMLALSGTHLATYETTFDQSIGLVHRLKALRGLSSIMSSGRELSQLDLEVVLATTFVLTFQASYMSNAFHDFITLLRGVGSVQCAILQKESPVPPMLQLEDSFPLCEAKLNDIAIDNRILDAAEQSLQNCELLCQSDAQIRFHKMQMATIHALRAGSWEGYVKYSQLYASLIAQPEADHEHIIRAADSISKILQAHLLAVGTVFCAVTLCEAQEGAKWVSVSASTAWIEEICETLEPELLPFVQWPLTVANAARRHSKTTWLSLISLARLINDEPQSFI